MDSKKFKKIFGEVAKSNEFENAYGGWFKESPECIVIIELQKSSFSNSNYLNIKVFIQGAFGKTYTISKDLIKSPMGHITNQIRDKDFLDFDLIINDANRKEKIEYFFSELVIPFTDKALSKSGIKELADLGRIILIPAVKTELKILV